MADVTDTLPTLPQSLAIAETMLGTIGYLTKRLLEGNPSPEEFAFLEAIGACVDKGTGAVTSAQETLEALAD